MKPLPSSPNILAIDLIPNLHPARAALGSGGLERQGLGILLLLALAIGLWEGLRIYHQRRALPLPPLERARRELEALRGIPEDAEQAGNIAKVLRFLLQEGFLEPSEGLATGVRNLLISCDAARFSPSATGEAGLLTKALAVVAEFEALRLSTPAGDAQ